MIEMKLKNKFHVISKLLTDPDDRFLILANKGLYHRISDEQYIKREFKAKMGYALDLRNPQTFNEKIQWLKLFDRNPLYTPLVDKIAVKEYVADLIGEQYIIPTIALWNRPEEINFDKLPNQFVLKVTHDSGGVVICKNKAELEIDKVKKMLRKCLNVDYYLQHREWPYKDVPKRIIAEEYLEDVSGTELKDYKIFTFDGIAKLIQVDYDRFTEHKRNIYDLDWNILDAEIEYPSDPKHDIPRPHQLERMIELSEIISKGTPHMRTDFYSIGDKIFFGELTFYHGAGLEQFRPASLGQKMGEWINLESIKRERYSI